MQRQFVAVIPRDFKRVKAAEARARAESRGATFRELVEDLATVAGEPNCQRHLRTDRARRRLKVGKATGFIEYTRVKPPARPVGERVGDYRHVYAAYPPRS